MSSRVPAWGLLEGKLATGVVSGCHSDHKAKSGEVIRLKIGDTFAERDVMSLWDTVLEWPHAS